MTTIQKDFSILQCKFIECKRKLIVIGEDIVKNSIDDFS